MRVGLIPAALLGAIALSGCAQQADWEGSRRLESERCQVAAQLFVTQEGGSDAELAEQLRPYVVADLSDALDQFAAGPEQLEQYQWGQGVLREWATLACGAGIAGGGQGADVGQTALPTLSEVQLAESTVDGLRELSIVGAIDPQHALALCEEARGADAEARITVKDADAFPLALAEAHEACELDPILTAQQ